MKKFLLIPLAFVLALGICACGGGEDNASSQSYETVVVTRTNAAGEIETEIVTVPHTEKTTVRIHPQTVLRKPRPHSSSPPL